jgi:hypothetical protein
MKAWRLQIGMGERADPVWGLQSLFVSELTCICRFFWPIWPRMVQATA